MKISTKGRYGLRAMVDLAANSSGDYVPICSISERQGLSENYMEQVFSTLRKAGLIKSIKGSQGGYTLGALPSEITVGQILSVLEGSLDIVDAAREPSDGISSTETVIKTHVWDKINESVKGVVYSVTLEMLTDEYRKINEADSYAYYI